MTVRFEPGRNCWRVERADRVKLLVDGEAYFRTFRSVVSKARRSVLVIGWDLDGRIDLVRGEEPSDGLPVRLGDFLDALVRRRPDLCVRLLVWDFAVVYALERDWLSPVRLGWTTSERLIYRTDARHPVGASHHQKVVVVDDRVAFAGGMDLGARRWDTREHCPEDDRRVDPAGDPYPPYHDVQMLVDGDVAAALGALARGRWTHSGGEEFEPPDSETTSDVWPGDLEPDLRDVDVAIARTIPANGSGEGEDVHEVEALHRDAIAAAERSIYIENQYLTSSVVAEALADRLREEEGPDVVAVLPRATGGWLERHTMDVLRGRVLRRLREADLHGRLRVLAPEIPGARDPGPNVHAKVMIVDDSFLRVGSANLSNRSMGLDTECDLAVDANGRDDVREAIRTFRDGLLAEHLGEARDRVAGETSGDSGFADAVDRLRERSSGRTLAPLDGSVPDRLDRLVPDAQAVDPEKPVGVAELLRRLVRSDRTPRQAS